MLMDETHCVSLSLICCFVPSSERVRFTLASSAEEGLAPGDEAGFTYVSFVQGSGTE